MKTYCIGGKFIFVKFESADFTYDNFASNFSLKIPKQGILGIKVSVF